MLRNLFKPISDARFDSKSHVFKSQIDGVTGMITDMGFVRVTFTKDLGPGKMLGVEANGKQILLVNLNGKYYAIGNKCTHRDACSQRVNSKERCSVHTP